MTMYERLQSIAKRENIIVGVGSPKPFWDLKKRLDGIAVPFVGVSVDKRTDPALTMPDVGSIVAIGMSYNYVYERLDDGKYRGAVSAGAVGEDYHRILVKKLEVIRDELLKNNKTMIFSDTGPLVDREVAIRCGLGSRGKNLSVINEDIGSMFFIGYMLTDVDHEKWEAPEFIANNNICGSCTRCIDSCPNNAIENGMCRYEKCISYITQKKGVLSFEESSAIGIQIYGCDICQRVCPMNGNCKKAYSPYAWPDIEELLNMSKSRFNKVYGHTAAGWRGKRTLQRNAIIALGNMKASGMKSLIEKYTHDDRDDIAVAAEYALYRIREI